MLSESTLKLTKKYIAVIVKENQKMFWIGCDGVFAVHNLLDKIAICYAWMWRKNLFYWKNGGVFVLCQKFKFGEYYARYFKILFLPNSVTSKNEKPKGHKWNTYSEFVTFIKVLYSTLFSTYSWYSGTVDMMEQFKERAK